MNFESGVAESLAVEYDFRSLRGVVRGKYAARCREMRRVIRLSDDVAFIGEASVHSSHEIAVRTDVVRKKQ